VIAQRLLRKLCNHCREKWVPDAETCKILGVDSAAPPTLYRSKGCKECGNSGYKGRIAVSEILPIDRYVDELIATGATRKTVMEYVVAQGFKTMLEDGIAKILEGVTDLDALRETLDITSRL
jgi:general secretion pathway protein E/type IV pilus assembly protein PilB